MRKFARFLLTGLIMLAFSSIGFAQQKDFTIVVGKLIRTTPRISEIDRNSVYGAPFVKTRDKHGIIGHDEDENEERPDKKHYPTKFPTDGALQLSNGNLNANSPNPIPSTATGTINQNFDGLTVNGITPSDNNMAVGPNHVIQIINNTSSSIFKIWNRAGTQVQAQTTLSSITGITGAGDPVVMYDQIANRWILTEFTGSAANSLIFAVSTSADPTGSYKIYSYAMGSFFADYPHYAVWQNAYYGISHDFNTAGTSYLGASIYAFDKAAMLSGAATATMIRNRFINDNFRTFSMLPVHQEGVAGSNLSGLFTFFQDDSDTPSPTDVDSIFTFTFTPDFTTPANSVISPMASVVAAPFNSTLCGGNACITQPSGGTAIRGLEGQLMHRAAYRNFGSYESFVGNFTTNAGGGIGGIRWFEMRRTGGAGPWTIFQEGTYAPADGNHRFMGSIVQNANGQIGLIFNITGSGTPTTLPSYRFTGRVSCDPLGQMTIPETTIMAGTAVSTQGRYGDYNAVVVDPVDGSFWGTGQYSKTGNFGNWATRIVNFTIAGGAITFTAQPADVTTCAGTTATFSVTVTGAPSPTYQWQVSTDGGGTYTDIPAATSATYSFTTTVAQNGNRYRCNVSAGCVSPSNSALLTIGGAAITTQPQNVTACAGSNVSFGVAATGSSLGYQWQVSTDGGGTYTDIPAATSATLNLTAITIGMNNNRYRVNITSACPGTLTSAAAILTVGSSASVTASPVSQIVCVGANVTFNVTATGSNLTYQWQVSTDNGVTWSNISAQTGTSLTLTAVTAALNNNQYRVVVNSCSPTGINSAAAILTVNTPISITQQPVDAVACVGTNTSFTVTATGTNATYQWQYAATCAGTFTNLTSQTNATLTLNNVTLANGGAYRVIVNGACGAVTSECHTLTVNSPVTISAQPADFTICLPATTATFNITAAGTGLTYQWQVSTDNGTTFSNIAGATTSTLTVTPLTAAMTGNKYRAVLSGTCTPTLNSNVVTLTVNVPVVITSQPASVAICAGSNASFSVAATGTGIVYQWQLSANGSAFANVPNSAPYSGVNTSTLTVTNPSTIYNGYQFRVIASNIACGAVTSGVATLTVNSLPTVVLTGASYTNINPSVPSQLYATVSPSGSYTYKYTRNGVIDPTLSGGRIPLSVDLFGTYQVTVTNTVTGCFSTSNTVVIKDSASSRLFIYPNPNSGKFQVRYYNQGGATTARSLNVYDDKGARVYYKAYPTTAIYQRMDVDLSNNAAGIYIVKLMDANGKLLASGKVKKD